MPAPEQLERWRKSWTRLPDEELDGLSDEHKEEVRQFEEIALNAEFEQLSDIILNCTDKYQFAKTYKALRADYERTMASPKFAGNNPNFPPQVSQLIRKIYMTTIERKLDHIAMWFWIQWGDIDRHGIEYRKAIEEYANPGCFAVFLFALAYATAVCVAFLILSIK